MAQQENYSVKWEMEKALLRLLSQKPLTDISVTDLVREAKVARVSFYRHFSSIADILESLSEQAAELFVSETIPPIHSQDAQKWRAFVSFYFHQISRNPADFLQTSSILDESLNSRLQSKVGEALEHQPDPTMWELYSWFGKLGLLRTVAQIWVMNGMQEDLEEMVDYVTSMLHSF